jgi:biotin carboxyl carrier protein
MLHEFKEVLLPILEELDEHDFDEAVIASPDCTVSIRVNSARQSNAVGPAMVLAPKAGNIEFVPKIRDGLRIAADDEVATLQILDRKIAVLAGISGTIRKLHSETGGFVQYGQPLLEIAPGG